MLHGCKTVVNSSANLGYLKLPCNVPPTITLFPSLTSAHFVNDVSALEKKIAKAKMEGAKVAKKQVKSKQSKTTCQRPVIR